MEVLKTLSLYHTAKCSTEWRESDLIIEVGQVLVRSTLSAVSGGTEGLFFQGLIPQNTLLDVSLDNLAHTASYPFRYGYSLCGIVEAVGSGENQELVGRRVFLFHPHAHHAVTSTEELHFIPEAISDRRAVFYPFLETALTVVLDAVPRWGESIAVFGLGPVGALVSWLLDEFPSSRLALFDVLASRCAKVHQWLGRSMDSGPTPNTFDVAIDLGGKPSSLAEAVKSLVFSGRLVIGSWQGVDLSLPGVGTEFHRKRLETVVSQVSTIAPVMSGRWNRERRSAMVWNLLERCPAEELISHDVGWRQTQRAFENLTHDKESTYQVVIHYD